MEDDHTTKVTGVGEVELKFISSKRLVLKEVLHTSKISKEFGLLISPQQGWPHTNHKIRLVYFN